MTSVGVIGCGYWGPNLIRNFVSYPGTELIWACDLDKGRVEKALSAYPGVRRTDNLSEVLYDDSVDAIAIATPVHTHFSIARACLKRGKHVLVEKPLASEVSQGEELVQLARENNLQIMCDHTFCYTPGVRRIKEAIDSGELGELLYFDSVRTNLGLFQPDINVVWDLAAHDISILDYLIDERPISVSVHGGCYDENSNEHVAYVFLKYAGSFLAHFHVNWLSPVKIRRTIICGRKKMLVWDDMEPAEKIKVYDKGVEIRRGDHEQEKDFLISYRSGDMYSPRLSQTEALSLVVKEFDDCIRGKRPALTDAKSALRVLQVLEASERSLKSNGTAVPVDYS